MSSAKWMMGNCMQFALVLAEKTGFPIYYTGKKWQDPEHVFLRTPQGQALDAEGTHDFPKKAKRIRDLFKVAKVWTLQDTLRQEIEQYLDRHVDYFNQWYKRNPLLPRTPSAPPWNPAATAKGVYITNSPVIAADYSWLVAEDDSTLPILIVIDIDGLQIHADPQAIDLLYEPFMQYRYDVVNYARDAYAVQLETLLDGEQLPEARKAARRKLGTVKEYILKFAATGLGHRKVRPEYPAMSRLDSAFANQFHSDKIFAAQSIFYFESTWYLLSAIHEFYGSRAPQIIEDWLGLQVDPEESPYSFNSVYLKANHQYQFEPEFWYFISKFGYLAEPVEEERVVAVYELTPDGKRVIYESGKKPQRAAYHGTGFSRIKDGLNLKWVSQRNPDVNIRDLERRAYSGDVEAGKLLIRERERRGMPKVKPYEVIRTKNSKGQADDLIEIGLVYDTYINNYIGLHCVNNKYYGIYYVHLLSEELDYIIGYEPDTQKRIIDRLGKHLMPMS